MSAAYTGGPLPMSAVPAPQGDLLNRILALTPAGQRELRDPRAGLSLPQRWLLVQVDGESSLADIAERTAGTAQVDRLPRDAAKLVSLGMAYDAGEPGPSEFGPSSQQADFAATVMSPPISSRMDLRDGGGGNSRSRLPMLAIGGALALAGVGAGYLLWSPGQAARPDSGPQPVVTAPAASAAPGSVEAAAAAVAATLATSRVDPSAPAEASALPPPLPTSPGAAGPGALPLPVGTAPLVQPAIPAPAAPPVAAARAASALRGNGNTAAAGAAPTPPTLRRGDEPVARPPAEPSSYSVAPAPAVAPVPAPATAPAPPTPAPTSSPAAPPVAAPNPPPASQATNPVPAPVAYTTAAASPPPAPAVTLAAAAPALRPLSNPAPSFPKEGVADGRREVVLKARLVIGPGGEVTRVEFSDSAPRDRVFERSARTALLQWRFPEGSGERSYRTELAFKLD